MEGNQEGFPDYAEELQKCKDFLAQYQVRDVGTYSVATESASSSKGSDLQTNSTGIPLCPRPVCASRTQQQSLLQLRRDFAVARLELIPGSVEYVYVVRLQSSQSIQYLPPFQREHRPVAWLEHDPLFGGSAQSIPTLIPCTLLQRTSFYCCRQPCTSRCKALVPLDNLYNSKSCLAFCATITHPTLLLYKMEESGVY